MEVKNVLNSELVQRLQAMRDYRSNRGKRYPLWVLLLVAILGAMSGAQGYRALEDFGQRHYASVCEYLGVTLKRLPSDTTLRRMFESLDIAELSGQFNAWAQAQFPPQPGACLSVDGKSLSSTLSAHKSSLQDFVGVVSVYSHQHRLVIAQKDYQNKKESEISVVQSLLEILELTDVTFTFDALHCQKNSSAVS